MKIKTLTLLAGASCLASVFALTSCGSGSLRDIEFKSYSNEISKEAFSEKVSSIDSRDNLNGYTLKQYVGTKTEISGDMSESIFAEGEVLSKYNGNDKTYYVSNSSCHDSSFDSGYSKEEKKTESQIQKNGDSFVEIDINRKRYDVNDNFFDIYYNTMDLENFLYQASGFKYRNKDGVKFYQDNDVYTAVYSKEETEEQTLDNITETTSSKIEVIYQFYNSDNSFYVKSKVSTNIETTTVKDGKKTTVKYETEDVTDIEVDFSLPSIDLIDISKYNEGINLYK